MCRRNCRPGAEAERKYSLRSHRALASGVGCRPHRRRPCRSRQASALPYVAANRGFNHEIVARLDPEIDRIADRAGHPPVFRDPCHDGKAHARGLANDIEDRADDGNVLNNADIKSERIGYLHRTRLSLAVRAAPRRARQCRNAPAGPSADSGPSTSNFSQTEGLTAMRRMATLRCSPPRHLRRRLCQRR